MAIDERDMSVETGWYFQQLAHRAMEALKKNGFDVDYAANRTEALTKVVERIPTGATVGLGDSVTLHQIGLMDWLKEHKEHEVNDPSPLRASDFADWAEFRAARHKAGQKVLTSNVYITGTNAITLDGKLVNIDAHGNRVAPMIFGPNKVIYVSGANKIVNDVDEGIKRTHEYAAPINTKRHMVKHGQKHLEKLACALTGKCHYCRSEFKVCRYTVIIDGWRAYSHGPTELQPTLILVGESLGI